MTIAAVSGTFNMIDPDPETRADGLRRLAVLAGACERLGTRTITLCTGTRDPEDMWRAHPENGSTAARRDLNASMAAALAIADRHELTLAFEPEVGNVIDSASEARRLLDEFDSHPRLGVVLDPANLIPPGSVGRMADLMGEAGSLLGGKVVLAHAKDLSADGASHPPAGQGVLDYDHFLKILISLSFDGPLILHGLPESEVAASVAFLRERMADLGIEETR